MLLFYAIVIGGGWLGLYSGPIRIINLVVTAVGLLVWMLVAARRPEWRPHTAIWPALLAPLGAFILSTASSDYRRLGLEFVAYAVLLLALYLLLVRIMALPYTRARIGGLVAAIALVMGAGYVIWSVMFWVEWWGLLGELRLPPFRPTHLGMTWGSPSVVLTVQLLMTVAAIGGLGLATRGARITVTVLVVLLAAVAIISGSRSGWLSIGGAIVIVALLMLLASRGRIVDEIVHSRWFRVAIVPGAIVLGLIAVVFGPSMIARFGAYGDGGRPTYWATALRMFEDAPVLGQGPGTWMVRRVAYTEAGELDLYQPHAHNQYLQTGAEFGIIGLIAGGAAVLIIAWLLARAVRGADPMRRRWAWASVFGLVYLALNVVVDVHTIPTVALLVGIPIAALDATSDRSIGMPAALGSLVRPLRGAATVLLFIACGVAVVYLARNEGTSLTHHAALLAASEGDWQAAMGPALDAAEADPDIGAYQMTAALALAAEEEWEAAQAAYQRVIELDDLPTAWLGLAQAQAALDRPRAEVEASLDEALRLGEQQAALAFAAGEIADEVGSPRRADAAYARALTLVPSLAADPEWRERLGDDRFAGVVDAAIAIDPSAAWDIALMADDLARARSLAAELPDADFKQRFIDAWDGDADALADVYRTTETTPEDASRLALAARVAARLGDDDAAAKYRRLARLGPHYGPATVNAGYGERDLLDDGPLGTSTYYYGTYSYRRAVPIDLLPPGLPGMVVNGDDEASTADAS